MILDALLLIKSHYSLIWLSVFIFILGFALSWLVERFNLKIFKAIPLWFLKKTIKYANPSRSLFQIAAFIFLFNSIAIFLYMLSGVLIAFPFLIAFFSGMNIGVMAFEPPSEEVQKSFNYVPRPETQTSPILYLAPLIALIEIFVLSFALAFGMSMGLDLYAAFNWAKVLALALPRIMAYFLIGLPLLLISAYLEGRAIKAA